MHLEKKKQLNSSKHTHTHTNVSVSKWFLIDALHLLFHYLKVCLIILLFPSN